MLLNLFFSLLLTIAGVLLGGFILVAGRRKLEITLAIVALISSANILARIFYARGATGWDLVTNGEWLYLAIAAGLGVLGYFLGRNYLDTAVAVIGFIAGAAATIWFTEIIYHLTDRVVQIPESSVIWIIIIVMILGGIAGLLLTRHFPEDGVILISVFVGVDIIGQALNLSSSNNFTAIIVLSLALAGVVVQYADSLRQQKSQSSVFDDITTYSEVPMTEYFDL